VILTSRLKWESLLSKASFFPPPTVVFPAYTTDQMIEILSPNCPEKDYADIYPDFVNLVCKSYRDACRDLSELQYLLKHIFPRYIEPLKTGKVQKEQTSRLFTLVNELLKNHLDSLYLREISSFDFTLNQKWSRASKDY
jgi:hypothetical protein